MQGGISLIESTAYITAFFPQLFILPTPRVFLIEFNKDKSFKCKVIENTICPMLKCKGGLTLHLVFNLAFGCTLIVKQPSASENPVRNHICPILPLVYDKRA